jgi:hypothetical protein
MHRGHGAEFLNAKAGGTLSKSYASKAYWSLLALRGQYFVHPCVKLTSRFTISRLTSCEPFFTPNACGVVAQKPGTSSRCNSNLYCGRCCSDRSRSSRWGAANSVDETLVCQSWVIRARNLLYYMLSPLSTGALYGRLQRVTIPDAVTIQFWPPED